MAIYEPIIIPMIILISSLLVYYLIFVDFSISIIIKTNLKVNNMIKARRGRSCFFNISIKSNVIISNIKSIINTIFILS